MSSLFVLPEDVILELAAELEVADIISLLATCHALHTLGTQKTLWINAIFRLKFVEMQPLPLHDAEDLRALSLHELQVLVKPAYRSMHCLPRAALVCGIDARGVDRVCFIPSTHLVLGASEEGILCWDILSRKHVAKLEIPHVLLLFPAVNPFVGTKGIAIVGGAVVDEWRNVTNLVAIRVDFNNRAQVTISHATSSSINPDDQLHPPTWREGFLNSQMFGFYTYDSIVSWDMKEGTVVHVKPQATRRPGPGMLHHLPFHSQVYDILIPSKFILVNTTPGTTSWTTLPDQYTSQYLASYARMATGQAFSHVLVPQYGVFAVRCQTWNWSGGCAAFVHFWEGAIAEDNSSLTFGSGICFELSLDEPIADMAVGISGRHVLVRVATPQQYLALVYLRAARPPTVEFRRIDIQGLVLDDSTKIGLDDTLGLVFVQGRGELKIFSLV